MKKIIITGSLGLIGFTCAKEFLKIGYDVIGIDNNSRERFFGQNSSVENNLKNLNSFEKYEHLWIDICDKIEIDKIFEKYNSDIFAIIHCAAQPSHDWSYKDPMLDFEINAYATLKILESMKKFSQNAFFILMSTNKIYGDNPNKLMFIETDTRYDHLDENKNGIDEKFNIDNCVHSLFGVNKLYSDLITQEYGKNFNLKTCILRCGCLTGGDHKGAELHGFLSYLSKCIKNEIPYIIYGYKGKQVRDNIHSYDVWSLINEIIHGKDMHGEIFNLGGGRENSVSVLEAIKQMEKIFSKNLKFSIVEKNRIGDHKWYISDLSKIKKIYPKWIKKYDLQKIYLDFI
jgi:CDP-paratose 2-epimerase